MAIDFTTLLSPDTTIRNEAIDARDKIALLRSMGQPEAANAFEQAITDKIKNKNPAILNDFDRLEQFYQANAKRGQVVTPESAEDRGRKAASIDATLQLFEMQRKKAEERGTQVDSQVAESIRSLIKQGDTQGGMQLATEAYGKAPTIEQKRIEAEMKASEIKQKKEDEQKTKDAQLVYAALKRDQSEIDKLLKQDISDVVGFTEPIARPFRRGLAEMGADWAKENELLRKKLIKQTSADIFDQARKLAPVTEADLKWLQRVEVPTETDNPAIWEDFLLNKKNVIEEKIAQFETDPELFGRLEIKKPDGATDQPSSGKSDNEPADNSSLLRAALEKKKKS